MRQEREGVNKRCVIKLVVSVSGWRMFWELVKIWEGVGVFIYLFFIIYGLKVVFGGVYFLVCLGCFIVK